MYREKDHTSKGLLLRRCEKKSDNEEKLKVENHGRPGNFLPIFPKRTNILVTQI